MTEGMYLVGLFDSHSLSYRIISLDGKLTTQTMCDRHTGIRLVQWRDTE